MLSRGQSARGRDPVVIGHQVLGHDSTLNPYLSTGYKRFCPTWPRISIVSRSRIQRVHNPRNHECGCDADCWCQRTTLGRAVKWWFPARLLGVHHKNAATAQWKRDHDPSSSSAETARAVKDAGYRPRRGLTQAVQSPVREPR